MLIVALENLPFALGVALENLASELEAASRCAEEVSRIVASSLLVVS